MPPELKQALIAATKAGKELTTVDGVAWVRSQDGWEKVFRWVHDPCASITLKELGLDLRA